MSLNALCSALSVRITSYLHASSKESHKKRYLVYPASITLTALILCAIFYQHSFAPFGSGHLSLANNDASIQYLDFFSYWKNVLTGKDGLFYSFSKGLGGSNIAVISYYLSSPFNFLVLFFPQAQLNSFFDTVVLLKLCTAALFMSFYLSKRFGEHLNDIFVILLSLSYALMGYNAVQSSNIMWLDGIYMLPLLTLGTYYCVNKHKSVFLMVAIGLSIIFNWYSAAINGMFLILWFVVELVSRSSMGTRSESISKTIVRFLVSGLIGIISSSFLLLPTLLELRQGRGKIDYSTSFKGFFGNPLADFQGSAYGVLPTFGQASFFAGAIVLFGFIGFWATKCCTAQLKISVGAVFCLFWLSYHWGPLFFVTSLLKRAESYWYRYSYLSVFIMIFAAGVFYSRYKKFIQTHTTYWAFTGCLVSLLLLEYVKPLNSLKRTMYTVIGSAIVVSLLALYMTLQNHTLQTLTAIIMVLSCIGDLGYNTEICFISESRETEAYISYVNEQSKQINAIKGHDNGNYRISQTSTRSKSDNNLTANYDEGYGFNYSSLSEYTSDPDDRQRQMLQNLGYQENGENLNVVNTSILSTDSLLGTKYILSRYAIEGLEKIALPRADGKYVYKNPYALPLAFTAAPTANKHISFNGNTFIYQNQLFHALTGEDTPIFKPVTIDTKYQRASKITYHLSGIPKGFPVYGDIKSVTSPSMLHLKGKNQGYSQWLAPSVVYIPQNGDNTADLSISSDDKSSISPKPLFYFLDLNTLKKATNSLRERQPIITHWSNGSISLISETKQPKQLVLSVPSNSSWSIKLDGKPVHSSTVAEDLISIPLTNGKHSIDMHYKTKGITVGFLMSLFSIILIAGIEITVIQRKKPQETNLYN